MDVTKVRALVSRQGNMLGMFTLDMVYVEEVPYVVFEWETDEEGYSTPVHLASLDARFLQPLDLGTEVTHQYRLSVEDPRPIE